MNPVIFDIIVIFLRYVHHNGLVLSKGRALFWFVKNIAPHFLGRAISNLELSFLNLVFDEEIPSLDVLGSLRR